MFEGKCPGENMLHRRREGSELAGWMSGRLAGTGRVSDADVVIDRMTM